jgi:fructokinase
MRAGEAGARTSYELYIDRLARGMAHVVQILDPDVIVLGGGMSGVEEIYQDLPARIAPWVFSDVFTTPVRPNRHGASSGVRGAAWLGAQP